MAFDDCSPGGELQIWFSSDGMKTWAAAATPVTPSTGGHYGIVIDDSGRTVVSYRHQNGPTIHLQLGVTVVYGRTWQRNDLGQLMVNENAPRLDNFSTISL